MTVEHANEKKPLPPPWDQVFSLGTRLVVWTLFFGILIILRPFLLLIFMTFVGAYILSHGVDGLEHRIRNRTGRVCLVFAVLLATLTATGLFLAPRVQQQAMALGSNLPQILADADEEVHIAKHKYPFVARLLGEHPHEKVEPEEGEGEEGGEAAGDGADLGTGAAGVGEPGTGDPGTGEPGLGDPATGEAGEIQDPEKVAAEVARRAAAAEAEAESLKVKPYVTDAVNSMFSWDKVLEWATPVLGVTSAFFLSLLFSFLIVLDLNNVRRGIAGLRHTKIGFIYDEVADNVYHFGKVLGHALEAQLFIAICNTVLTAIGIYFMGLDNIVFLSAIVFICSFIPVAGVFISSAPICLMALQQDGFGLMLVGVALIVGIHFVEAYFLNPKIFGHHLHMNPVLVLIVLTIGGKLFGVWGLILGLPVVNYFFRHAIRRDKPPEPDEDKALAA